VKAVAQHAGLALANLKLRDSLRDQSIRDHLTGLYNRRFLEESLERELARAKRARNSFAVFMLDADYFKRFNDQFGHETGDAVLRTLGKTIKESCRRNDLPCRFGGEEFTVVLTDIGRQEATQWGERLLSKVRGLGLKSGEKDLGRIAISAGIALYPEHGEDIETLLQAADIALYEAKQSGRDRLVVYRGIAGDAKPRSVAMDLKPEN
jgi:diguanylate cyclase (GGDEF)-like protein